jgi:hypothetical protein
MTPSIECRIFTVMLGDVMLNVVMLSVMAPDHMPSQLSYELGVFVVPGFGIF